MASIQFYHLLTTPLERALPKLMEKAVQSGKRSLILCADEAQATALNTSLWTYDAGSFLPHGGSADPNPDQQPVYITHKQENPNAATILVVTDGSTLDTLDGMEKLLDIFDGHDPQAVAAARERWKHYSNAGHAVSYIKQQKGGGWQQEATNAQLSS